MRFFLGILAGLFVLSRLQGQGGLVISGSIAATPGHMGEIPYGGAAGIITASPDPVLLGNSGVGGGTTIIPGGVGSSSNISEHSGLFRNLAFSSGASPTLVSGSGSPARTTGVTIQQ